MPLWINQLVHCMCSRRSAWVSQQSPGSRTWALSPWRQKQESRVSSGSSMMNIKLIKLWPQRRRISSIPLGSKEGQRYSRFSLYFLVYFMATLFHIELALPHGFHRLPFTYEFGFRAFISHYNWQCHFVRGPDAYKRTEFAARKNEW